MPDFPTRLGKLRVRDLLLLELIDELGSLQRIAERLHVTQPAVTQALQVLEDGFGVPLARRGRRGVELTELGHSVLTRVSIGCKELVTAYALAQDPHAPHLRLGCSPIAAMHLVPNVLAGFYSDKDRQAVRVTIMEDSVPSLWSKLTSGDLDAIVTRMPTLGHIDFTATDIDFCSVGGERMVLVTSQRSRLNESLADKQALAQEAWILPPRESLAYQTLAEWFIRAGVPPPVPTVVSASFHTSLMLAAKTGMVTLAPESVSLGLSEAFALKIIEAESEWKEVQLVFACRRNSLLTTELALMKEAFVNASLNQNGQ